MKFPPCHAWLQFLLIWHNMHSVMFENEQLRISTTLNTDPLNILSCCKILIFWTFFRTWQSGRGPIGIYDNSTIFPLQMNVTAHSPTVLLHSHNRSNMPPATASSTSGGAASGSGADPSSPTSTAPPQAMAAGATSGHCCQMAIAKF